MLYFSTYQKERIKMTNQLVLCHLFYCYLLKVNLLNIYGLDFLQRTNVSNTILIFSNMNFPFQLLRRRLDKADINLLMKIKVFMFDCDGVLWRGQKPIVGAIETLNYLKENGKHVYYCVWLLSTFLCVDE